MSRIRRGADIRGIGRNKKVWNKKNGNESDE